ncbi:MAG: HAD family hydrolase [Canibacter sp.]
MTEKRLVALDLDGTVLFHNETVDPEVKEAVQRLDRDPGTEVVVATGRSVDAALAIVELLKIRPTWVICANGAIVLKRDPLAGRSYRREFIETFDTTEVLNKIRPHLVDARYAVEDGYGKIWHTDFIPDTALPHNQRHVEFDKLLGIQASRVVVASPGQALEDFLKIVERIGITSVTYAIGHTAWLDLAPDGITKASALERVNGQLRIPRTNVFAAGDGDNDSEMLRWAGKHGAAVVMGQATDQVKKLATWVTGSVEEKGLLTALKRWHPLLQD